ncbi:MAG: hypothetical protein LBJ14_02605 [Desulfarculales bacterium]|nr:hypothetical protein [Desulfarculales bacterium]
MKAAASQVNCGGAIRRPFGEMAGSPVTGLKGRWVYPAAGRDLRLKRIAGRYDNIRAAAGVGRGAEKLKAKDKIIL